MATLNNNDCLAVLDSVANLKLGVSPLEPNQIIDLKNTINEYFKPVYDQSDALQGKSSGPILIPGIPKEIAIVCVVFYLIYLFHELFDKDGYLNFRFSDIGNKIRIINNSDITISYQLWSKLFIKRSLRVFLAKILCILYIIVMPLFFGYYIFLVTLGIVIFICVIFFALLSLISCAIMEYNEL